jgi:signal transduction histidine kinase
LAFRESDRLERAQLQQRLHDCAVMAGRVAHAFDNILTGILGFAELTLSQLPPGSTQYRYLEEVIQAAQQGAHLTQQLHNYSRCGTVTPGPVSLSQVLAEEEARLRSLLGSAVALQVSLAANLPPVAIGPDALRQVLCHLLDNAREAVTAGSIKVSARPVELTAPKCQEYLGDPVPGPYVEVTIVDDGAGLSAEARRRFTVNPFVTTKTRHQGLGLAVASRILFGHRGGIHMGPAPEKGTVVRVVLPVAT